MSAPLLPFMNERPHMRIVCVVVRVLVGLAFLSLFLGFPGVARGDEAGPGVASFVGRQASGLPGLGRVAVASDQPLHLAGALGGGLGYTEAQGSEASGHTRVAGSLGLAVQPLRFFAGALMLDGRRDAHPDDALGSSSTFVGEPRLFARAAQGISRSLALGGQLGLRGPGGEAPSLRPDASTLDATLLFTFAPPGSDLALALNAGYRIDRSGNVVDAADRSRLRPGDRLTLALSDFDAVLLGAGVSKRLGSVELLGELTWDVLVGTNAPSPTASPLRAGAGGRYLLGDAQIELRTEIGVGGRPGSGPLDAFAPVEPRVAVLAGLRWVLPFEKRVQATPETIKPVGGSGALQPPPAVLGAIEGRVTSESGAPIAGARVTVTAQDGDHTAETGADGTYRIADLPLGRAVVVVKAPGQVDATAETNVEARTPARLELVTKRAIKPGQLRGLVRSFSGKALAATIRVEPLGTEAKTDADGMFQIEVPPGSYQVVVAAPGHTGQRRPVQVEENGVTVLNADLRPGPP